MLTGMPHRPHGKLHPNYVQYNYSQIEDIQGVQVRRHQDVPGQRQSAVREAVRQIQFAYRIWAKNRNQLEKPDVIMASSPDFFQVIAGWRLARRHKVPFVMEVRDLWPEIFKDMGVVKNSALLWILGKLAYFMYAQADAIVTVTNGYAQQLVAKGVHRKKVFMVPNAVGEEDFKAAEAAQISNAGEALRAELQINPLSKVILYVGNHGKAQALGQIIDAARLLMNRSDIQFLVVGDGTDKPRLLELAKGLPNIQFLDNQSKERVWALYDLATVSLSCLKDIQSFSTTIPSKIFEIMAAKRPLIAALQGEAADIVQASGGGLVVSPERPEQLAEAIIQIVEDPVRAQKMATQGRAWVEEHRKYHRLSEQYLGLLQQLTRKS